MVFVTGLATAGMPKCVMQSGSLLLRVLLLAILLATAPLPTAALAEWQKVWAAPPSNVNSSAPAPPNRQSQGMTIWKDTMLVQGGLGLNRGGLGDLWSFDLTTHVWRNVSQQRSPTDPLYYRSAQSFFSRAEQGEAGAKATLGLYMWGGREMPGEDATQGSTQGTNKLLKFVLEDGKDDWTEGGHWITVPTSSAETEDPASGGPAGRSDHSGLLYKNATTGKEYFVVYGGRKIDAKGKEVAVGAAAGNSMAREVFGDTWSLDMSTKEWTLLHAGGEGAAPPSRFLHAASILNDTTMVVFGGLTFYGSSLFALDDVWLFDLRQRTWQPQKMEVNLLRSALPMLQGPLTVSAPARAPIDDPAAAGSGAAATATASSVVVPAMYAFAGYVIYTSAGLAVVYNDLLVWDPAKNYWQKLANKRGKTAPAPRFDHRGLVWRGSTLVFYGGSYQDVNDVGDIWMIDTSLMEESQLVKAPPEGLNALFAGRMMFILSSLVLMCLCSAFLSLRMRRQMLQRARAAGGEGGVQGGLGGARGSQERARATEEALRLLPVRPYCRSSSEDEAGMAEGGGQGDGEGVGGTGVSALGGQGRAAGGAGAVLTVDNKDMCAICLMDYVEEEMLRELPCGHRFHVGCVDQWFRSSGSLSCPMCKARVVATSPSLLPSSSTSTTASDMASPYVPSTGVAAHALSSLLSSLNPFRGQRMQRLASSSSSSTMSADAGARHSNAHHSTPGSISPVLPASASRVGASPGPNGVAAGTTREGEGGTYQPPDDLIPYHDMSLVEMQQPVATTPSAHTPAPVFSSLSSSSPRRRNDLPPRPPMSQPPAAAATVGTRNVEEGREDERVVSPRGASLV